MHGLGLEPLHRIDPLDVYSDMHYVRAAAARATSTRFKKSVAPPDVEAHAHGITRIGGSATMGIQLVQGSEVEDLQRKINVGERSYFGPGPAAPETQDQSAEA